MKKCEFCGKEISYFDMYCQDECQENANKFYDLRDKYGKLFAFLDAIFVFLIPIGIMAGSLFGAIGDSLIVIGFGGLGIMLLLLPFPTESMIRKHQIKKAMFMCRIFALILILIAIIGIFVMF